MTDRNEDKKFNVKGLMILLISVTVFLAVISYLIDYFF